MHLQFNTLLIMRSHWYFFCEMSVSFSAQNKQMFNKWEAIQYFVLPSPFNNCTTVFRQPQTENYNFTPCLFVCFLLVLILIVFEGFKSIDQPLQYTSERKRNMIPVLQMKSWATKKIYIMNISSFWVPVF